MADDAAPEPRIIIVLGGANTVWKELHEATLILGDRPYEVGCCNDIGTVYEDELLFWATLHPEKMPIWREANAHPEAAGFTHSGGVAAKKGIHHVIQKKTNEQRRQVWNGSSGLYAVQIALDYYQASHVIVCGIPMNSQPNAFRDEAAWETFRQYRFGWNNALEWPSFKDRVRSMRGWTREQLGAPDDAWLPGGAEPEPRPSIWQRLKWW